jgi:hypothetical protein
VHFETPESDIDVPALRSELVNYREELQQYAADRAARLITREQMLLMTEQTTEKINQIEQQLSEAEKSSPVAKIIGSKDPAKAWDALMLGERRVIIREFFSIKLRRVGSGRRNVKIQDRIAIQPLKESDS